MDQEPAISAFWHMLAQVGFVLVSTDSDFEQMLSRFSDGNVVVLRSCDYPTEVASEVLRRK